MTMAVKPQGVRRRGVTRNKGGSRSRPTKRRRSRGDMDSLRAEIRRVVNLHKPMTVRQVFYQLVSAQFLENTRNEYQRVSRVLVQENRRRHWAF